MMRKLALTIGTFFMTVLLAYPQVNWPAVTRTSKPWTRWWWEGSAVNKTDLTYNMQLYQRAGLGGLEITPIYGVKGAEQQFIPFLSPQWVGMLEYTLQEAKRLDLGIDMATGTGWPFGGPWVTPEDACKNVNLKTYTIKAGESLTDKVAFVQQPLVRTVSGKQVDIKTLSYPIATNKNLQEYAFDQVRYEKPLPLTLLMGYDEQGNSIDLTGKVTADGTLNWKPEAGNWTLYALFQGWHGKMVERAAPGGEGDAIDHFSLPALQHYLQQFDKAFAGKKVSGVRSFFNDSYEVDDARGQANWTPDLFREFQQRRGYDLRKELPALYGKDTPAKNTRILSDYRQTISELLLEKFTTPWHSWAKAKGALIRNQSHGSPANILDLYGAIDIPETEGTDILRFKFATSTAHVMGKPLASSESATWLNEHFLSTLGDVKLALDKYFIGGVNHIFYHGTNYSPKDDPWPGWLFYAAVHFHPNNPFWKDFPKLNQYVARCQSFLQGGKPDNDVLLYFPIYDRFAEPGRDLLHHFDGMEGFENTDFKTSATWMLQNGYAFDLISDKQIQKVNNNGAALTSGGNAYKTIMLSAIEYLPLETLQKLVTLAKNGATIIVHKELPAGVPGYGDLAKRQAAFKQLLAQLKFTTTNGVQKAVIGKGAFVIAEDMAALLSTSKAPQETMAAQGLQCIRRQTTNGKYYFITNMGNKRVDDWVTIGTTAGSAALFDPMQERKGKALVKKLPGGQTAVYLQLNPGESCLLQTAAANITGTPFPYYKTSGDPVVITGTWNVQFISGGPTLPAATTVTQLTSWTEWGNEDLKKFAGTAQYSIHFAKPAANASAWLIDLGKVQQSAEVILNGKSVATVLGPVFQAVISGDLLKADNLLEVKVTNGMANRISDMDRQGVAWKKFYNTNFPSRLAENRGADGLFTAVKWSPYPSGLTSEVKIVPITFMK
jgi:2-keto-3-deoxy-6-phosphogluconate aldolase